MLDYPGRRRFKVSPLFFRRNRAHIVWLLQRTGSPCRFYVQIPVTVAINRTLIKFEGFTSAAQGTKPGTGLTLCA